VTLRVVWCVDTQPRAVRRALGLGERPGPQAWVASLAERLGRRADVELSVVTWGARRLAPFVDDGVVYRVVPVPEAPTRAARTLDAWRHRLVPEASLAEAAAVVRGLAADMVHVHGTEGAFGLLAGLVAPAPCVVSLQGILQAYLRQYFAGRSPEDLARFIADAEFAKGRGPLHDYLLLRRRAAREKRILRGAHWFIGRTAWDEAVLRAVNPTAVYFHCDEIMRAPFYEASWSPDGKSGRRIYTTSSDLMGKGTECLLRALRSLPEDGRGRPRLRVGGVPLGSELDRVYRRAAKRFGVEDRVEWLGRLDAPGIVRELLAADVFAYPTRVDNSPNALVEAMLLGVPVVAAGAGGVPSLVAHCKDGLVVPPGDVGALARAVRTLLRHREEAARLGAAARAAALRRNDPAAVTERTVAIYRDVIADAVQPRADVGTQGKAVPRRIAGYRQDARGGRLVHDEAPPSIL